MTAYTPIEEGSEIDLRQLDRELDKVKSKVFLGRHAAFLGSLMSSLEFVWTYEVKTAATDGVKFYWNPNDFLALPPEERCATIEHELWHCARLHMQRRGSRDPKIWNIACDIRINRDLRIEGYTLPVPMWIQEHRECPTEVEEEIYDFLYQNAVKLPPGNSDGHMVPGDPKDGNGTHKAVNNVVKAITQAKIAGAGNLPGGIEEVVSQFLAPVVPWETHFQAFFNDLLDEDYSWKRPNRRYSDMYLPSRYTDDGRLEHLLYAWDVSGSITQSDEVRFNSEVKYIWDTYQPRKLTLVQFDTRITSVQEFEEGDEFRDIKIKGRGGTNLAPLRDYIIQHEPTAAVIFSDLECAPMQPLPFEVPTIWVAVRNKKAQVHFGQLIHIKG